MLQQTQVTAVIPYYLRFLARFPDLPSLAAAPTADVMALWSGLGYYARARNLHRCAQAIVDNFDGVFPAHPDEIATLPGIGRSTAAAIAVFAFGKQAAILDGNVKRVFTRVFGIVGDPGSRLVEDTLWQRAQSLLPKAGIESYTQGLMDLGATICTRSKPVCNTCPLAKRCVALATDRVNTLPTRRKKAAIPEKRIAMLVLTHRNQILLEQRPDFGIWGGLLSLPEMDWPNHADIANPADRDSLKSVATRYGEPGTCTALPAFSHTFTHFRLHIHPFAIAMKARKSLVSQDGTGWHDLDQLAKLGLPAPVRKLLATS